MSDDQGNNLGNLGNPWLKTPHIDRFANEAVYLSNFHQDIMCTQSRASLMTGKYALRTGAWRTSVGRSLMRTEEITIAEVFKESGYKTGHFGKWHLGDNWPFRPMDQGFDEVVQFKCGGISQISDYWGNDYFDDTYYHNGEPKKYKGYCTDVFFNETIRFIKESKDEPFMIYLAPNIAHLPAIVGEEYSRPFEAKGHVKKQAIYYGMITNLDENMGRLFATLEEEGLSENTIVVYTTDDGTAGYAAQFDEEGLPLENGFNMGQRGGKGSTYEGGHRVFSYIKWPGGNIIGGKKVDALTSVTDIFPTLTDLCGIESSVSLNQDGKSFKPALYGKNISGNESRVLFVSYLVPEKELDFKRNRFCVAGGDWRWISRQELYNVKDDRAQKHNVAIKFPEIAKRLDQELESFLAKNAMEREIPVRFILGDERAKTVQLTTQDLWGKSVFSQGQIEKLQDGNGGWKVDFKRSGKYRFTLSRYPLYTNLPFNYTKGNGKIPFNPDNARLIVGGDKIEKTVNPRDNSVSMDVIIKKGQTDLVARITAPDGIDRPAYFVKVEYLD